MGYFAVALSPQAELLAEHMLAFCVMHYELGSKFDSAKPFLLWLYTSK